jgi:hypothetical protein
MGEEQEWLKLWVLEDADLAISRRDKDFLAAPAEGDMVRLPRLLMRGYWLTLGW